MSAKIIHQCRQLSKVLFAALRSRSMGDFYDDISNIYDDIFTSHKVHAHKITQVLTDTFASRKHNVYVLDLGCGTGMLSMMLTTNGFNVIGMDISFLSLCRMKLKMNTPKAVQGDAISLPFHNSSFGAVVSLGSWRHFPDIETAALETSRILAAEGVFIVGYFPPALGGVIRVSQHWWSQLMCGLYRAFTRKLGYWDRTDCLLVKETEQIFKKQFKEVLDIASSSGKQLLIARYPITRKGTIYPDERSCTKPSP